MWEIELMNRGFDGSEWLGYGEKEMLEEGWLGLFREGRGEVKFW